MGKERRIGLGKQQLEFGYVPVAVQFGFELTHHQQHISSDASNLQMEQGPRHYASLLVAFHRHSEIDITTGGRPEVSERERESKVDWKEPKALFTAQPLTSACNPGGNGVWSQMARVPVQYRVIPAIQNPHYGPMRAICGVKMCWRRQSS